MIAVKQAAKITPKLALQWLNIGLTNGKLGDPDKANYCYLKALKFALKEKTDGNSRKNICCVVLFEFYERFADETDDLSPLQIL